VIDDGRRPHKETQAKPRALEESPNVTITFVPKPWWLRFLKGVELFIFGSIILEGKITDIREDDRSR
jgi:hypothetical protein